MPNPEATIIGMTVPAFVWLQMLIAHEDKQSTRKEKSQQRMQQVGGGQPSSLAVYNVGPANHSGN